MKAQLFSVSSSVNHGGILALSSAPAIVIPAADGEAIALDLNLLKQASREVVTAESLDALQQPGQRFADEQSITLPDEVLEKAMAFLEARRELQNALKNHPSPSYS